MKCFGNRQAPGGASFRERRGALARAGLPSREARHELTRPTRLLGCTYGRPPKSRVGAGRSSRAMRMWGKRGRAHSCLRHRRQLPPLRPQGGIGAGASHCTGQSPRDKPRLEPPPRACGRVADVPRAIHGEHGSALPPRRTCSPPPRPAPAWAAGAWSSSPEPSSSGRPPATWPTQNTPKEPETTPRARKRRTEAPGLAQQARGRPQAGQGQRTCWRIGWLVSEAAYRGGRAASISLSIYFWRLNEKLSS